MKTSCIATCIVYILGMLLLSAATSWLWNLIIPSIFEGGPTITIWQALGIIFLLSFLRGPTWSSKKAP